jgi:stage III sporulation protein AF
MIYRREEKMNWISGWIQGIIIAVIIGTIIEMLLPDGNCKKYVKVVIGVYILFSIVSPVITKVTGNEFRVSDIYDINTYIEVSTKSSQENIENSQQNQIKQVYITNLKNDMKQKIQEKGYSVKSLTLEISNDEQYTLKKIFAQVSKRKNEENNEVKGVNEINITISNTTENIEGDISISTKEQNDLKEYLSGIYNLEEKNINIY